ncbi:MAG TPA: aspartyl/asparaginyl beta-hydroxylase domain-containing protein [Sphingomicrobium sp.]|nr:aspartyl/asparaginyl beta-hydroxylase domain-containing protein [Sphingomicrobium sp.]
MTAAENDRLVAAVGEMIRKGDLLARANSNEEAASSYRTALAIAEELVRRGQHLPPAMESELGRASAWFKAHVAGYMARIDEALSSAGFGQGRRSEQIDEALAILRGEAPVQVQQPTSFYFPGLPQRSFYDRSEFDWAPAIEERTPAIRRELEQLIAMAEADFQPYIPEEAAGRRAPNAHLAGDPSWSAFHLMKAGQPITEHADRCPETMAALTRAPLVDLPGRAPMALFSLLRPGAHIRPHHGLFNFRLICHLPVLIPPGCSLRVGNQQREWREGELLVFDDSMEHEAWNRSAERRVVLIFEIWRPEIGEADRAAISVLLKAANISAED